MNNPFDPPKREGGGRAPTHTRGAPFLDLSRAIGDGWGAVTRNGLVWFGASIVGGLAAGFSLLLCIIPVFVVGPAIAWGSTRFTLDAVEGEAEFGTIFKGFERLAEVVVPMLLLGLFYFVANLPPQIVGFVGGFLVDQDSLAQQVVLQAFSSILNIGWGAVVLSRFLFAVFIVVDEGVGAVEAVTKSWQMTEGHWGGMALIFLLASILPIIGLFFCFVGVIPAAMLASATTAEAYRQLSGARA